MYFIDLCNDTFLALEPQKIYIITKKFRGVLIKPREMI